MHVLAKVKWLFYNLHQEVLCIYQLFFRILYLYVIFTYVSDLPNLDKTEELNALANLITFFWLSYKLIFFVFTSIYPIISFQIHST